MTSPIHPHWHTTDANERSIPVRNIREHTPEHRYPVRHPAAMVGIALVLGLGMVFINGIQELRGQVGGVPIIIRITDTGFEPSDAFVMPNQSIIWRNEQEVPHILTSDTLAIEGGTLSTPHILPGGEFTTRLAPHAEPGSFTYVSLTVEDLAGTITVTAKPIPLNDIPSSENFHPTVPVVMPALPTIPPPPTSGIPRPLAPLASIPRNPYALEETLPLPPATSLLSPFPVVPVGTSNNPPLVTTIRPFQQPETGPRGIGSALITSIILVTGLSWYLTRRYQS